MKKPFKHFDLPKQHLTGEVHYVPTRARDPEEIERRRTLPRGSLLAEQQWRGVCMAANILGRIQEEDDVKFASRVLSASGLNSAWYGYAQNSNVMRRRLNLPEIPVGYIEELNWSPYLLEDSMEGFAGAAVAAKGLAKAIETRGRGINLKQKYCGQEIGNVSLTLACVRVGDIPSVESEFTAQRIARQEGLATLQDARTLGAEIGTPPTLAQLPDPDSDLSVYIRRNAPDVMYEAYDEALELYRIPA